MSERGTTAETTGFRRPLVVLAYLSVAMVGIALIQQNRTLKAALAQREGASGAASYAVGDMIPSVVLQSLDGANEDATTLLAADLGVVAFLTTTCPFCESTLPHWDDLANRLRSQNVRFHAISLDGLARTQEFAIVHGIAFDLRSVEGAERARLTVRSVPDTLLFSKGGEVLSTWRGALDEARTQEIIARVIELQR